MTVEELQKERDNLRSLVNGELKMNGFFKKLEELSQKLRKLDKLSVERCEKEGRKLSKLQRLV